MIRLLLLLIVGLWLVMANADKFSGSDHRADAGKTPAKATALANPVPEPASSVVQVSLTANAVAPQLRTIEPRRVPTQTANMVSFLNPVVIGDDGKIVPPAAEPEVAEVAEAAESDEPQIAVLYISAKRVNVRAGPSTANSVIGSVEFADAVQILSDPTEDWVKIRVEGDGVEGFMASRFLTESAPQG